MRKGGFLLCVDTTSLIKPPIKDPLLAFQARLAPISTDARLQNRLLLHHCGSFNIILVYEVSCPPLTEAHGWSIFPPLLQGPRWEAEVTLAARDPSATGRSKLTVSLTFGVDWKQTAGCAGIYLFFWSKKNKMCLSKSFLSTLFFFLNVRKHNLIHQMECFSYETLEGKKKIEFDSKFSVMPKDKSNLSINLYWCQTVVQHLIVAWAIYQNLDKNCDLLYTMY